MVEQLKLDASKLTNLYFRLAAFFFNDNTQNKFICGGSLVSRKVVVTAAHCVRNKGESENRKAEDSTFYFGKYNLESISGDPGSIVSGVTQLIVHPQWNSSNTDQYDSDIAIALLLRTVEFSKFIRPICIWTETKSYSDMVGKEGIVVGWGKTDLTAISTQRPMWTKLPVVKSLDCVRSDPTFSKLTSDSTFCAGDRTGTTGPCNGDSGMLINSFPFNNLDLLLKFVFQVADSLLRKAASFICEESCHRL